MGVDRGKTSPGKLSSRVATRYSVFEFGAVWPSSRGFFFYVPETVVRFGSKFSCLFQVNSAPSASLSGVATCASMVYIAPSAIDDASSASTVSDESSGEFFFLDRILVSQDNINFSRDDSLFCSSTGIVTPADDYRYNYNNDNDHHDPDHDHHNHHNHCHHSCHAAYESPKPSGL